MGPGLLMRTPSPATCPLCSAPLPAKSLKALARHFPVCPSTKEPARKG